MKRVLVVDDSKFMRTIMKNILANNGYTVAGEANNGRVAWEKYKELSPDIVTMDITMEEMDGLEALKEIICYDRSAKVVMCSAMGQKPFVEEALKLGAKGFLIKPYDESLVMKTISKL